MAKKRKPLPPIKDFFGNIVKINDRFFYGNNPPHVGRVIKLRKTSLMMEIGWNRYTKANETMNVKSPNLGICLDKIPEEDSWMKQ